MKVIGRGNKSTYLVEMEVDEMANLCGFPSYHSEGYRAPDTGQEVKIVDLFLSLIRRKTHAKTIQDITEGLQAIIKDIQIVDPLQDIGDVE